MNATDLRMKFKQKTGIMPVRETIIDLENCEFIDDYYLVSKADADSISEDNALRITRYSPKYIEWLEEHFSEFPTNNI